MISPHKRDQISQFLSKIEQAQTETELVLTRRVAGTLMIVDNEATEPTFAVYHAKYSTFVGSMTLDAISRAYKYKHDLILSPAARAVLEVYRADKS